MPVSEAEKQVAELRAELAKERAVAAGGTRPENPGKIRGVRKSIARLLTVINEKKRAGEISGGKKAGAAAKQVSPGFFSEEKKAGAKQVEKKAPVAKAISQSFFPERKKGFSKGKKAVVKKVAAKGKFSPGFLPIGKKAEKGKAKKGVNRV